ncbi:hypothetical protein V1506DRAFT_465904 [Lipomyces tetrasporus]
MDDALAVADYVQRDGYCRRHVQPFLFTIARVTDLHRFVLGKYMDGSGFSCLTFGENTELCDRCWVTREQVENYRSASIQGKSIAEHSLPQHAEGPIPRLKRVRADTTGEMKDHIEEVFSWLQSEEPGCPLCAAEGQGSSRASHELNSFQDIAADHNLNDRQCTELGEELDVQLEGTCYGCGLSLQLLNGIEGHTIGRECSYRTMTRLICCDIIFNRKLATCLTGMDPTALQSGNMASCGRWLRQTALGETTNNLSRIVYNWIVLTGLEERIVYSNQTQRTVRVSAETSMAEDRGMVFGRAGSSQSESAKGSSSQTQRTVRVGVETLMSADREVTSTIAEKWLKFMNIIRAEFHGCSICAVSNVPQQHGSDDSFNQMFKAHGYQDVNQFMQFERMTYFDRSLAKELCFNCSLPRRLISSMQGHQGRVCPSPRATRALCYVAWKQGAISSYVHGIDVSGLDLSKLPSFCTWLIRVSAENAEVFNMTHFVVNMMLSSIRL